LPIGKWHLGEAAAMTPHAQGFDESLAVMGGAAAAGAGGGAAAAAEGAGAAAASTANQQALYQMAFDVGLEGAAADAFVASGGTMGSTAAGGGGVGLGAATGTAAAPGVTSPVGQDLSYQAFDAGAPPPAGLPDTPIPGAPGSDTLAKVGATAGTGTALSRIMDGKSTPADWVNVLGTAGATGLGMYSANQQANTLADLAEKSRADRAPFLGRANEWLTNPSAYIEGPGQAAMKGTLAGLSAKFGNPIGSGAALQFATDAGLRDWRDAVTGMANLGLSGEDTRARLGIGAAGAEADMWSNLGGGISEIVNPRRSLADLLREYRSAGLI